MTFEEAMRDAAKRADRGVATAMRQYKYGRVTDEDDLTGVLVGAIAVEIENAAASGLSWSASILRHRSGQAAEEKRVGADLLIHVALDTPSHKYSKGVLVQAKRLEQGRAMLPSEFQRLKGQCDKMLDITASSFVFDYATNGMRCGAATKIAGSEDPYLYSQCSWTPYRFFRELFRCPIGDRRIGSSKVAELPVANHLSISASGVLDSESDSPMFIR